MACSHADVYDSTLVENNQKTSFADNFVKKYGAISPNQTWDFTTGAKLGTTRAGGITTQSIPGLDFGFDAEGNKTKNTALFGDMSINLPSKSRSHEDPSLLLAPGTSFDIYPISAQARWMHTLYIKVGDNDPVAIYSKDWGDTKEVTTEVPVYCNGMKVVGSEDKYVNMTGLHVEAPLGTPIEIYLGDVKSASGKTDYPNAGTANGQTLMVETSCVPEGIDIPENAVIKYLGIEDNTNADSDLDYNDIVLVMIGTQVPDPVTLTDKYTVPTNITKRYMIEDLGATDDFDFNDIVVDVAEITEEEHTVTKVDGIIQSDVITGTKTYQKAWLRHLGGILPFQLTIGNTQLPEMQGKMGANPDIEFDIEG